MTTTPPATTTSSALDDAYGALNTPLQALSWLRVATARRCSPRRTSPAATSATRAHSTDPSLALSAEHAPLVHTDAQA
jgi:hypothetical protein